MISVVWLGKCVCECDIFCFWIVDLNFCDGIGEGCLWCLWLGWCDDFKRGFGKGYLDIGKVWVCLVVDYCVCFCVEGGCEGDIGYGNL